LKTSLSFQRFSFFVFVRLTSTHKFNKRTNQIMTTTHYNNNYPELSGVESTYIGHYTQDSNHQLVLFQEKEQEESHAIASRSQNVSYANARHIDILTRMITDGEWQNALDFMTFNPSFSRSRIMAHEFMGGYRNAELYPIHLALSCSDVPMEFILGCVKLYPNSVRKRETGYHRNVLHIAFRSGVPDNIISYLIQLYPGAASQQDALGRLPLHYAISNVRSKSIIQELLNVYPEAVKSWDVSGWTPLHIAAGTYTSAEMMNLLVTMAPEMVAFKTDRGSTPLEIALKSTKNNKDEIVPILKKTEDLVWSQPLFKSYQHEEEDCLKHHGKVVISGTYT
jgi:hypothetical protein